MAMASGIQLKPFIIMVLYKFGSYNFAEKSMPVPPGGDLNHALLLLLAVYGSGLGSDGPGELEEP